MISILFCFALKGNLVILIKILEKNNDFCLFLVYFNRIKETSWWTRIHRQINPAVFRSRNTLFKTCAKLALFVLNRSGLSSQINPPSIVKSSHSFGITHQSEWVKRRLAQFFRLVWVEFELGHQLRCDIVWFDQLRYFSHCQFELARRRRPIRKRWPIGKLNLTQYINIFKIKFHLTCLYYCKSWIECFWKFWESK